MTTTLTTSGNIQPFAQVVQEKSELAAHKSEIIAFLYARGSLKVTPDEPILIRSNRRSEYYFDSGMLHDGESVVRIGNAIGQVILDRIGSQNFDVVFGPPYKGIALSTMTAGGLHLLGVNKDFASYRREKKPYGEGYGSGESKEQRQRRMIIGEIKDGARVVFVDNVISTGGTVGEAIEVLNAVANDIQLKGGIIILDRQELNEQGEVTIEKIAEENKLQFYPVITTSDVIDWLEEGATPDADAKRKAILDYAYAWGIPEIRRKYGLYQQPLIQGRTLIPALDVDLERALQLVRETRDIPEIGGFKIPAISGYEGWKTWGSELRKVLGKDSNKKLIMDGQKFGNDIPETGREVVWKLKKAGFDAVILFPFTGPNTQVAWTGEAIRAGLTVLVGAEMTHQGFLRTDGGLIHEEDLSDIFRRAARQGVTHYVFPGNKPEKITFYINLIKEEGIANPVGFSPGFIAQGGKISAAAEAARGISYHPIVGRGFYAENDVRAAAMKLVRGL